MIIKYSSTALPYVVVPSNNLSRSEVATALAVSLRWLNRHAIDVYGRARKGHEQTTYSVTSVVEFLSQFNPGRPHHHLWPNDGQFWTEVQAAECVGKSPNALRQLRSRGKGPRHIVVGASVRFRPEDVEAWLTGEGL